MKRELLLTFALCFKVLCICVWNEERETKWNSSAESWLEFHVNYCGRYCDGFKLEILRRRDCENIAPCFPCDCDPFCDIHDTCCPHMVNNSYVEPSFHTIDHLPNPDRFQCKSIPKVSKEGAYYIISDCDPTFLSKSYKFSSTKWNFIRMCRNPKTRTLDDITPYTDIYYGIVFANKFCAICNGYVINDSTTYGNNLTFKKARPWTIEISCKHYQNLYHLTNEYEFFFAAAKSSQCKITLNPPPSKIPPKVCIGRLDENVKHVCTHQDSVENQMCQNLPRRKYLQAGLMANIFCFLCNGSIKQSCAVYNSEYPCSTYLFGSIYGETPFPEPPIKMLLTFKKRNHFDNDNTCISPLDWFDFQVVCLNG
ncbi:hypothetical protein BgiBS90_006547 [Biomphalaria glabrata]|nr:hypothetical protein BgiBS90_006547 [Biomphalaria glabrata]